MKISQKLTSVSEKNCIVLLFRAYWPVYRCQIPKICEWNPQEKIRHIVGTSYGRTSAIFDFFGWKSEHLSSHVLLGAWRETTRESCVSLKRSFCILVRMALSTDLHKSQFQHAIAWICRKYSDSQDRFPRCIPPDSSQSMSITISRAQQNVRRQMFRFSSEKIKNRAGASIRCPHDMP